MLKIIIVVFAILCILSNTNCQDAENQTDSNPLVDLYLHIIEASNNAIKAEQSFIKHMLDLKAAGAELGPAPTEPTEED